jgi:hypothetical protein
MRDYRRYDHNNPDEPWWAVVTDSTDALRYARTMRLSAMRHALMRGPSATNAVRKLAGYQRCLDSWQLYLETGHAVKESKEWPE